MQPVEYGQHDRAGQGVDGVVVHNDSPFCLILIIKAARMFRAAEINNYVLRVIKICLTRSSKFAIKVCLERKAEGCLLL